MAAKNRDPQTIEERIRMAELELAVAIRESDEDEAIEAATENLAVLRAQLKDNLAPPLPEEGQL